MQNAQIRFYAPEAYRSEFNAVVKRQGTTQQEVLLTLLHRYLIENAPSEKCIKGMGERCETDLQRYEEQMAKYRAKIAPIKDVLDTIQSMQEQEEARQKEVSALYDRMKASKNGKKLLAMFARRLHSPDRERAFLYMYEDNQSLIESLFGMSDSEDIVRTSIALAEMHSN